MGDVPGALVGHPDRQRWNARYEAPAVHRLLEPLLPAAFAVLDQHDVPAASHGARRRLLAQRPA